MFINLIVCAHIIEKTNYSRLSLLYYLSSLQYMLNTKIGVIVVFDELADKQMFPTLRGLECIKEKME